MTSLDIPPVCRIADLLRVLGMSRRTFCERRKSGTFPIPEILPRIGHPRFRGDDVRRYINGDFADLARSQKHVLRRVQRAGHLQAGLQ